MKRPSHEMFTPDFCETFSLGKPELSWVGASFLDPGFVFGTSYGTLLFTDEEMTDFKEMGPFSAAREAVNGAAAGDGCIAVSTRADVTFRWPDRKVKDKAALASLSGGAHGIVALANGMFVASLGRNGLLVTKPSPPEATQVDAGIITSVGSHFYRLAKLPNPAGADAVIVTMRQKGVAAGSFDEFGTKYNFRTASFNDVDFVDACALDPKNAPLAAAAIGRDGTLVLFRDAIKDRNPLRIRFNSVVGDVYRVLSSHGHIVVLTSKGIFVLTGLAEHFLKDTRGGTFTTSVLVIPMEAFDADMGGERYLLVLTPDNDVCRIDMSRIEGETVSARSTSEFTPAEPKWEERAGEPEQRLAVAA